MGTGTEKDGREQVQDKGALARAYVAGQERMRERAATLVRGWPMSHLTPDAPAHAASSIAALPIEEMPGE